MGLYFEAMSVQLEFPFAVLNDERAPTPRVAVAEPRSLAQVVEQEQLLDHITPPEPEYEFLSPATVAKVELWLLEQYKTRDVVLKCMARISQDFFDQGQYTEALETIQEAWDCDRSQSCSLRSLRHASLDLLRAKCLAGLERFAEAREACARASAAGLKQADDYAAMLEAGDRLMVALVGPNPAKT